MNTDPDDVARLKRFYRLRAALTEVGASAASEQDWVRFERALSVWRAQREIDQERKRRKKEADDDD